MMSDVVIAKFNARLAIISSILDDATFILPIWLLYSLHVLNFNPTTAVAIFMSIWITSAVLEIPTGALADRLGRKKIFIIGQLLFALYPLAYALKFPAELLLLSCLISGLGSAMRSGALIPIVHKSYEKAGLSKKEYNNFLSNDSVATFIARALSGVVGGALYVIDPRLPFFAMFVVTIMNFLLGFLIRSSPKDIETKSTNLAHIKITLGLMRRSEVIASLVAMFAFFSLSIEAVWTGYQVFFSSDGRAVVTIGILFSVIAVCSATGAYAVRHLSRYLHPVRLMQIYGLGGLLTASLLLQPNHTIRLLAIFPLGLVSGLTYFTLSATIQSIIKNEFHSTALSVVNFVQYAIYGIGSLFVGILFQAFSTSQARIILFSTMSISFIVVSVYIQNRSKLTSFSLKSEDHINV